MNAQKVQPTIFLKILKKLNSSIFFRLFFNMIDNKILIIKSINLLSDFLKSIIFFNISYPYKEILSKFFEIARITTSITHKQIAQVVEHVIETTDQTKSDDFIQKIQSS